MSWKQKIEDHPLVFFFSILVTGFCAGLGAYHSLLSIANLESIQKNTYVLKDELKDNYISKEKHVELATQLKQENQNFEKNLKLNYVVKSKYDSLVKQLNAKSQDLYELHTQLDSLTKKLITQKHQLAQEEWKVKHRAIEAQERIDYIRACVMPAQISSSQNGSSFHHGTSASQCADEYDKMKRSGRLNPTRNSQ